MKPLWKSWLIFFFETGSQTEPGTDQFKEASLPGSPGDPFPSKVPVFGFSSCTQSSVGDGI